MGDTASFCTEVRKEKEDDAFRWRTCNMGLALQRQKERTNKRKIYTSLLILGFFPFSLSCVCLWLYVVVVSCMNN